MKPDTTHFRQECLAKNNYQGDCSKSAEEFFAFIPKNLTGYPAAHALARYRCFLPDLAGLAGLRRAGPGVFNSNIFASAWVLTQLMIQGRPACAPSPGSPTCAAFALGGGGSPLLQG
jgi:hypothetical protein